MIRTAYRSRDSYAQVNWEMVKEVGGDITLAVVFDWIAWKADAAYDGVQIDEGGAWYPVTVSALAETMNVSDKVIRRALDQLVKLGHLEAAEHRLGGPYDRKKSYRPVWEERTEAPAPSPANDPEPAAQDGDSTCPTGQMGVAPEGESELPSGANVPLFETVKEPTDEVHMPTGIDEAFAELWKLWPRKDAKKAAVAKFKTAARKLGSPGAVVEQAKAWLKARPELDPQHVPYAATWLHQERWLDEAPRSARPLPPGLPPRRHPSVAANLDLVNLIAQQEAHRESSGDRPALDRGIDDRPHPAH